MSLASLYGFNQDACCLGHFVTQCGRYPRARACVRARLHRRMMNEADAIFSLSIVSPLALAASFSCVAPCFTKFDSVLITELHHQEEINAQFLISSVNT